MNVTKDPDAVLDYAVDWTAWLVDDDTIATSAWTVPDGLTKSDESNTDTKAIVWLSGGTLGVQYAVVNRITTSQGRTEDRTFYVRIRQH